MRSAKQEIAAAAASMPPPAPLAAAGGDGGAAGFLIIELGLLYPSPTNPRKHFDQQKLAELADSIRTKGILQPLIVREIPGHRFEIVAGERRFRAAKVAGLAAVPAIVRNLNDDEILEIQTIENLQREDVPPIEEAAGYQALLDRGHYDVAAIAAKVGKSPAYVYGRLKLLSLAEPLREEMAKEGTRFTLSHAVIVARLVRPDDQAACLKFINSAWKPPSLGDLRDFINGQLLRVLGDAPFRRDDAALLPEAGRCTTCTKRTDAQSELFEELGAKDDRCLDASCYDMKVRNFVEWQRQELERTTGKPAVLVTRDWSKPAKGVVGRHDYSEAKQTDRGATVAVVASGEGIGETIYVKLRPAPSKAAGAAAQEKEAARRKRDEQERLVQREMLRTLGGEVLALPNLRNYDAVRGALIEDATPYEPVKKFELLRRATGTWPADEKVLAAAAKSSAKQATQLDQNLRDLVATSPADDVLEVLAIATVMEMVRVVTFRRDDRLVEIATQAGIDVESHRTRAKEAVKAQAEQAAAKTAKAQKKPGSPAKAKKGAKKK